jgi:hypothetical protein
MTSTLQARLQRKGKSSTVLLQLLECTPSLAQRPRRRLIGAKQCEESLKANYAVDSRLGAAPRQARYPTRAEINSTRILFTQLIQNEEKIMVSTTKKYDDPGFRKFLHGRSTDDPFGDNLEAEYQEYLRSAFRVSVEQSLSQIRAGLASKSSEPELSKDGL